MKNLNLLLLLLIISSYPFSLSYAFFDKDIRMLTMQNGLADNTVTCIYKDEDGFMWFGTGNGLSCYDGTIVRNFKPTKDYTSIFAITKLSDEYLGILSSDSLYYFNRKSEVFVPAASNATTNMQTVTHILPIDQSSFWEITNNQLVLCRWKELKTQEGKVSSIQITTDRSFDLLLEKNERLSDLCYDKENEKRIWLITDRGNLILFQPDSPQKTFRKNLVKDDYPLRINSIICRNDIVWISTITWGILRYHVKSGHIDRISYGGTGKENLLSHTDVYQTIYIGNDRYLAVTWSGYTLLLPDKEHPEELTSEVYNYTHTQIYRNLETRMLSAYYDPTGLLWIGTNGGGVMYSDLRTQFYNRYYQKRHNEICSILTDDNGYIWLATFHQGIMKSNTPYARGKKLEFTRINTGKQQTEETLLCALKDRTGNLWFGNRNGTLTHYDLQNGKFTIHSLSVKGNTNRSPVWALHIDRKNRFWIGTEHQLLLYDYKKNTCTSIPVIQYPNEKKPPFIREIAETNDGTIWLGTSNRGVCKVIESDSTGISTRNGYEQEANIEYCSVRSLLASSDGNLYIGYMDGFGVLSPSEDAITQFYTTNDGLCSNFVGCIVEDGKGRIWLGSNSGISRYSRHQHLFYNYYISGSNRSATFYDETLFMGNNQSLTYFNPDEIDVYPGNKRVLITGLEVDSRPVEIGTKVNNQVILNEGISHTDHIVLNNSNRDFSLTFNNLSYSTEQQKYNYRLLPYQENWLISNDGGKASYTNLPAGEYIFEVKNIYPDGQTGPESSLKITILPHWKNTTAFRFVIFLLLLAVGAYLMRLVRIRQRRMEREMQMKHELLTVNLEREKERQLRMERENFFTGVAHELRTPLTLILAPLQELMAQCNMGEPFYRKLQVMYQNATSLHTLVDHLLYVQKIEAGMVKLQLSETNLIEVVRNASEPFRQMAEIKGLNFETNLPNKKWIVWIDTVKIHSAVQNLLSNAFKYTSAGGSIQLSVSHTIKDGQGYYQILVSDTGTGIPTELQKHVFKSFITGENLPEFSTKIGIGLHIVKNTMDLHHGLVTLQSEPRKGSTFILHIPEGKEHFAQDSYELAKCQAEETEKEKGMTVPLFASTEDAQEATTKKSLLIIEDNEEVRQYICSLFNTKYTIHQAANGEEGVRVAKEKLPDLIISDVMMPVKDGFTCCREIRLQPETAHIPILMLTAKAEDADVVQGSYSGADDYMMKPFNPEILKAKVDNLILQREQLKRIYTKALMLKQNSEKGEKEDVFLQQLIHTIEANISDENFNVKKLAEQLNMSQPTLYRKAKQRSDLSVIDMIRSIRISKAASLILENRYSIQEISEMVGYSDTRTLRKHFMEQFGVSPSKYIGEKKKS